jgi:hypothetical protein
MTFALPSTHALAGLAVLESSTHEVIAYDGESYAAGGVALKRMSIRADAGIFEAKEMRMSPESIEAVYARGSAFTSTDVTPLTVNPGGMVTRARSTPVLVPVTNV